MSIITTLERRSWPGRTLTIIMYTVLTLLAVTMVTPFLITMASSVCNDYDYERYSPLPRYMYSQFQKFGAQSLSTEKSLRHRSQALQYLTGILKGGTL